MGVPSEERQELTDGAAVARLLDRYRTVTLEQQASEVARAAALAREKASALLCFEADPARCHRGPLAERVATLAELPIRHLEVSRG